MKILVAGSTGYLGIHILKELQNRNYSFYALARNPDKLKHLNLKCEQLIQAEVTNPQELAGTMKEIDVVISTVGITRQKDGLSYMDVDFQGNKNLLEEAIKSGVKKFIYISAINGDKMRHLKIMEAKEKFVDALRNSGMDFTVLRPNGFFSDMKDFLDMASKGKVYLFGDGAYKLNPIHGADLAGVVVDAIDSDEKELEVGGPDILTQNEIAEIALMAWNKPLKIVYLPDWIRKSIIGLIKMITSSKTYGPIEFFLSMMGQDNIAPRYGIYRLKSHFIAELDQLDKIKSYGK